MHDACFDQSKYDTKVKAFDRIYRDRGPTCGPRLPAVKVVDPKDESPLLKALRGDLRKTIDTKMKDQVQEAQTSQEVLAQLKADETLHFLFDMGQDKSVIKIKKATVTTEPTKSLRNSFGLNHSHSGYWFLQGFDFNGRGVTASAVDAYRQAIRIDPANIDAMMNMAAVYEH